MDWLRWNSNTMLGKNVGSGLKDILSLKNTGEGEDSSINSPVSPMLQADLMATS